MIHLAHERGPSTMGYAYRVKPDETVQLREINPDEKGGLSKSEALPLTDALGKEMSDLLELLYAANSKSLLLVLQGRDTAGKDGAIRHMLQFLNVQSCRVVPFKVPTVEEAAHDFLWRIHEHAPARGSIALFNRSHYEDVLVVRVHNLVPEEVWKRRYAHINAFESLLCDGNTIILKFYLHISKQEQEERLRAREKDPTKSWKLAVADWKERELWDEYTTAYEEALSRCSPAEAPWFIVPADHKWFRDLAITERIVKALRPYREEWMDELTQRGVVAKREIEAFRETLP